MDVSLSDVVKKVPFKKFKVAWIPFIGLAIFFVIFLVSILVIYTNATESIKMIDHRINIFQASNDRYADLAIMSSRVIFIYMFGLFGL